MYPLLSSLCLLLSARSTQLCTLHLSPPPPPAQFCLPLQENIIPASFHDGLLLYVQAVSETLAHGGTVTNGENITQRMWNRSFTGQGLEMTGKGFFLGGGRGEYHVPQQEAMRSL